jgi:LmbE family N-acetylglucosaminyl deacetylase
MILKVVRMKHPPSRASLVLPLLLLVSSLIPQLPPPAFRFTHASALMPRPWDRVELHQALLDLTNPFTVMCVAAHPDDEDGTTLTMLRRKFGVHTVSLFSTYGEGGQNAVGPQLYQELGVIRARETMAASEIQGSEPYFLGLNDFGYSKSAAEAFRFWGEKEALRRMVLKIRQLRPDAIITNHGPVGGHGHHQATGRLLLEAFDAAADRNIFPEQLKQVDVWQTKRLFVRYGFGRATDDEEKSGKVVTVDPNELDPVRQLTFGEQALRALQQHATQGPWPRTVAERLKAQNRTSLPLIRYRLVRELAATPSLPANPKSVVDGLLLPVTIGSKLAGPAVNDQPLTNFADRPAEALVALINARKAGLFSAGEEIIALDAQRFRRMKQRLDRALAVASGISLSVKAGSATLIPGVESQITVTAANSGDTEVALKKLTLTTWGEVKPLEVAEKLPPGTDTSVVVKAIPPKGIQLTVPAAEHLYDGRFLGERVAVGGELEIEGATVDLDAEIRIPIVPKVEITRISPAPYVRTYGTIGRDWSLDLTLKNHLTTAFRGRIIVEGRGFRVLNAPREITLQAGETQEMKLQGRTVAANNLSKDFSASSLSILLQGSNSAEIVSQRTVRALFSPARVSRGTRVGYLPSFDETLEQALAALGVEARKLTVSEIQRDNLDQYTSIIIDNRGYEAHPELIAANSKLLEYVNKGGTLIVFYHKANEWNPDVRENRPQLAPYKIILGDARVTEEDAAINFLQPNHPLLRHPNTITASDFTGWVQERGLYYPAEWDDRYQALFSSHDEREPALNGGLLVGSYGKGNYVYTSMVWYRQLQAGSAGAYRMFANMISYRG